MSIGTEKPKMAETVLRVFRGDAGSAALKRLVTDAVNERFAPVRARRAELANDDFYPITPFHQPALVGEGHPVRRALFGHFALPQFSARRTGTQLLQLMLHLGCGVGGCFSSSWQSRTCLRSIQNQGRWKNTAWPSR